MEINYSLESDDFLTQQLYRITRDKTLQAKRHKQWILLPIVSLAAAIYFYYIDLKPLAFTTGAYILITFLFYRKYFDFRYKNYFNNFVKKNYAKRIGTKVSIEFLSTHILAKDEAGETKLKNEQVDYIADLPNHFLLHLKIGEVIIIPKLQIDALGLKQNFEDHGFVIVDESNWQWGQNKYL